MARRLLAAIRCRMAPKGIAMATPGQDRVERRLAAILAADVAGYSRLTGLDEEGTHAQRGVAQRNTDVPEERRIEFRIGINVGDIIIEGGDIFGDGVNVAARLEGVAAPGGICISDDAHRQVRGKLDVTFVDAGERQLKNIARPMRVFRVALDAARPRLGRNVAPAVRRDSWSARLTAIGAA